jgi:predicted TIM-barrel fold metal-dependent hydrolase
MIVDVHTHTPTHVDAVPEEETRYFDKWNNGPAVKTTNSWSDYFIGTAAADVSIVFNIKGSAPAADGDVITDERTNETTAEFAAAHPDRLIGFMSLIPGTDGVLDEMDQCMEWGLRGIKLGPNYQNFDPVGPAAFELYGAAEKRGLPILFHQGASPNRTAPLRYAHPVYMDEIALAFPELRVVMAHLGHPWMRDTVVTIRKHPHVYADISAIYARPTMLYEGLILASEWGVMDKLLFGSDFPVTTSTQAIDGLRGVNDIVAGTKLPTVSREAIEQVVHADALTALGLRMPAGDGAVGSAPSA